MSAAEVAAIIAEAGETVTLRRLAGTQQIPFDVTVKASIRSSQPGDIIGAVSDFTHAVTISNAEIEARAWPGPPVEGDQIIRDGFFLRIEAVETLKLGEVVARHNLACKG